MLNKTNLDPSSKPLLDVSGVRVASKEWMQSTDLPQSERTLSANERTSLSALISYIAEKSGENEFRVERRLSDRFNIANVMCLPPTEYDNAIRYLTGNIE